MTRLGRSSDIPSSRREPVVHLFKTMSAPNCGAAAQASWCQAFLASTRLPFVLVEEVECPPPS